MQENTAKKGQKATFDDIVQNLSPNGSQNIDDIIQKILTDQQYLSLLKELTELNLSQYPEITDKNLTALLAECPNLKHIAFALRKITNSEELELVIELFKRMPGLESIITPHGNAFTTKLDLSQKPEIKSAQLKELLQRDPLLKSLTLYGCYEINNESVMAIAQHCPDLKHLDLSGCHKVTNQAFKNIKGELSKLQVLILVCCDQIDDESIQALIIQFQDLKQLGNSISILFDHL